MSISIHYILIWCFQKCIFSRGEECKCRKKSSHNVHLLVLMHNISRLYVEVGDHNLVLAPTSILAVIYSSELERVSLDFWSGVVVFLIRHHHVTFKSSELERYAFKAAGERPARLTAVPKGAATKQRRRQVPGGQRSSQQCMNCNVMNK